MRAPAFLRRAYARLFGYFWLPCPVCGECFGGFEAGHYPNYDRLTCRRASCQVEARHTIHLNGWWDPENGPCAVCGFHISDVIDE